MPEVGVVPMAEGSVVLRGRDTGCEAVCADSNTMQLCRCRMLAEFLCVMQLCVVVMLASEVHRPGQSWWWRQRLAQLQWPC